MIDLMFFKSTYSIHVCLFEWLALFHWLQIWSFVFLKALSKTKSGFWIILALTQLPFVVTSSSEQNFPNISFQTFSTFVSKNFSSEISLSAVLMVLFTMTNNTDLLSLHAKDMSSNRSSNSGSGWMNALAFALIERLGEQTCLLFPNSQSLQKYTDQQKLNALSKQLDAFAKTLQLYSVNHRGQFKGKLKSVSHAAIDPIYILAPSTPVCLTQSCNLHVIKHET